MSSNGVKITYIANARIPTEKAHGIQIMKMCEAFALCGAKVKLVVPRRRNKLKQNPFVYYGVRKTFEIKKLPTIDLVGIVPKLGFWIESFIFSLLSTVYCLRSTNTIIYSRDDVVLWFLSFFKKNLYWESHRGQHSLFTRRILRKCKGIVVISQGLKDFYVAKGVPADKILVAPDGVDLEKFQTAKDKLQIREELGLPEDKRIVMYTGHLYDWKGARILLEAAKLSQSPIADRQSLFVFVGGTDSDVKKFKQRAKDLDNVLILGHKPHQQIPGYLAAAEVLVVPTSGEKDIGRKYTSPMKLFEYMASEKPIVASDLPSLREILDQSTAAFFQSDEPESLKKAIIKVLNDSSFSAKISRNAKERVKEFTWSKRAEKIYKFIK